MWIIVSTVEYDVSNSEVFVKLFTFHFLQAITHSVFALTHTHCEDP